MTIKNFLRPGNIAQPPFSCTSLFPPTPNYSHTFHKMTLCSALLIHRGYISSAVDAFVCDTNSQSLLFTLPVIMRLFRPQSETPLMVTWLNPLVMFAVWVEKWPSVFAYLFLNFWMISSSKAVQCRPDSSYLCRSHCPFYSHNMCTLSADNYVCILSKERGPTFLHSFANYWYRAQ